MMCRALPRNSQYIRESCPDIKIFEASMQSKLIDAIAFAKKLRSQENNEKSKFSNKYSSCKSIGRRVLEGLYEQ